MYWLCVCVCVCLCACVLMLQTTQMIQMRKLDTFGPSAVAGSHDLGEDAPLLTMWTSTGTLSFPLNHPFSFNQASWLWILWYAHQCPGGWQKNLWYSLYILNFREMTVMTNKYFPKITGLRWIHWPFTWPGVSIGEWKVFLMFYLVLCLCWKEDLMLLCSKEHVFSCFVIRLFCHLTTHFTVVIEHDLPIHQGT